MKIQTLKSLCAALLLFASAIATSPVFAQEAAPAGHAGVVQAANDMSVESVVAADRAAIHVVDHDDDYDVKQMSGKLTVLNGAEKFWAEADRWQHAGGHGYTLGKGAKVVAEVTEERKTATVRLTIE